MPAAIRNFYHVHHNAVEVIIRPAVGTEASRVTAMDEEAVVAAEHAAVASAYSARQKRRFQNL